MRLTALILGLSVAVLLVGSRPAHAECEGGTRQLIDAYRKLGDGDLKTRIGHDIDRAVRDLDEGDEAECTQVLKHAQLLLKTNR